MVWTGVLCLQPAWSSPGMGQLDCRTSPWAEDRSNNKLNVPLPLSAASGTLIGWICYFSKKRIHKPQTFVYRTPQWQAKRFWSQTPPLLLLSPPSPPPLCGQRGLPEDSTWWLTAPSSLSSLDAFQDSAPLNSSLSLTSLFWATFFFFSLLNHRLSPDGDGMPSEEWASFQAPSSGDGPQLLMLPLPWGQGWASSPLWARDRTETTAQTRGTTLISPLSKVPHPLGKYMELGRTRVTQRDHAHHSKNFLTTQLNLRLLWWLQKGS